MLIKLFAHIIMFVVSVFICGIMWVFIGKNKATAVWNASLKMDNAISVGGEEEEILND